MEKRVIRTDNAVKPAGAYSQAMVAGNLVFTAGMTGVDPKTGKVPESVADQTRQALRNLAATLEAAGTSLENAVNASAFISDIKDFEEYNTAYREVFPKDPPARTTVQATLAKGYKVEISLVALVP
jgi:reactive intermediate/imine deaminase